MRPELLKPDFSGALRGYRQGDSQRDQHGFHPIGGLGQQSRLDSLVQSPGMQLLSDRRGGLAGILLSLRLPASSAKPSRLLS